MSVACALLIKKTSVAASHVVRIHERDIRHPLRGEDGFISCEQLGAELHQHLGIECSGNWPPAAYFPEASCFLSKAAST